MKASEVVRVLKGEVVPCVQVIMRPGDEARIGKIVRLFDEADGGEVSLKDIVQASGLHPFTAVNVMAEMGTARFVQSRLGAREPFYQERSDGKAEALIAECDRLRAERRGR